MFCTRCGKQIPEGMRFCTSCGSPVKSAETPVSAESAPDLVPPVQPTVAMPVVAPAPEAVVEPSAEQVRALEEHPKKRKGRGKIAAIAIAAVLVLAVSGGAGYYFGVYVPEQQRIEADRIAHSTHAVTVGVKAEGWDTSAGASRLPLQVTGTDLDGNAVDEVQYADSDGKGLELIQGDYDIKPAASPLATDGSIYTVPDATLKVEIGSTAGDGEAFDLSGDHVLELPVADPLTVTDKQIETAYEYASQDEGAKDAGVRADPDALKRAATKKRDDAVAQKQAEEEAARKKAEEEARKKEQAANDAFVETARKGLGVPDSVNAVCVRGDSYYWEGAAMTVYPVTFKVDGKTVASADCTKDGVPATSILQYTPEGI